MNSKQKKQLEQRFIQLYQEMTQVTNTLGLRDPFSYAVAKEYVVAFTLGHEVAPNYSGADAINKNGEEVEYKSTMKPEIQALYSGISNQQTWEEQVPSIKDKILKRPEHVCSRFEIENGGILAEVWKLTGRQVYDILLPKLKKSFDGRHTRKDPRLAAYLTHKEIRGNGKKILL